MQYRWLILVLGIWLVLAPSVLGYASPTARVNDVAVGIAVAVVAVASVALPALRFLHSALGAWLLLAPWLLAYGHDVHATVNDLMLGLLVLGLSMMPARRVPLRGGRRPVHV